MKNNECREMNGRSAQVKWLWRVGFCVAMVVLTVICMMTVASAQEIEAEPTYSEGLVFTSNGDGTCSVSGIGACTDTEIRIPPVSPSGDVVTAIRENAFYSNKDITGITVPASVKSIGKYAFYKCDRLAEITFAEQSQLTKIDHRAFGDCSSLTRIVIPESVSTIGTFVLSGCSSLTSITVAEGNGKYHSSNNCLIHTASKKLVAGCKTSVIPSDGSVKNIGTGAFYGCSSLTGITVPEGITGIEYGAFEKCSHLTSITLPESLTGIGQYAFEACGSLISITIPAGVTSVGRFAFYNCSSLKSVVITEGVTSIEHAAFSGCRSLTELTIPESVTSIASHAFSCCSSLEHVDIPASVTILEDGMFSSCTKLTSVHIPDSVITIGSMAFDRCSSLTSITLPDSVTTIESGAFSGCNGLTSMTIPPSVTSINDYTFQNCSSLTTVTIPAGVTKIGYISFLGCHKLTTVNYMGTAEEWTVIKINNNYNGNAPLFRATFHFAGEPLETVYHYVSASGLWVDDHGIPAQGLVKCADNHVRSCINGIPQYAGTVADEDGYIYYINSSTLASVWEQVYYITKDNDRIPNGYYTFDEQGRLMDGNGNHVTVATAMSDGLKYFADGSVVYYENGAKKAYAGLIEEDGNYYYINDNAKPVVGRTYYITRTNGLTFPDGTPIPQGTYEFDEDGKMIVSVKNGLINGYYYVNNVKTPYAGLIYQDGNYYYIGDYAKPVAGRTYYITNTHGLLPKGSYIFDEDGVLQLFAE